VTGSAAPSKLASARNCYLRRFSGHHFTGQIGPQEGKIVEAREDFLTGAEGATCALTVEHGRIPFMPEVAAPSLFCVCASGHRCWVPAECFSREFGVGRSKIVVAR
jgi:hypothetical protein